MNIKRIGNSFESASTRPVIPEGVYEAKIVAASYKFAISHKVAIDFEISGYCESTFSMFCNVTLNEDETKMLAPGRSTKLAKAWRRAKPGVPLSEIDLSALVGIKCLAKVSTSKRDADKREKPQMDWYSVVTEIVDVVMDTSPEDDIPF